MIVKKAVMIGLSGHFEYALPYMRRLGLGFEAIYCDPREETDGGVARLVKNGFDVRFADSEEALYRSSPDICVVNSIPGLNAGFAERALKRGCSVFCEKPLATEKEALLSLRGAYLSSGRHIAGMFGTSFTGHVAAAKKAMGLIGEPRLITAQKSYKLGRREDYYFDRSLFGGIIPWVTIHSLDWVYTLTGLLPVGCDGRIGTTRVDGRGDIETEAVCRFELSNGAELVTTADYLRPSGAPTHDDDRIRIAGDRGVLEISGGTATVTDRDGERRLDPVAPADIFEDFVKGDRGEAHENTARKAFDLTEWALEARDIAYDLALKRKK